MHVHDVRAVCTRSGCAAACVQCARLQRQQAIHLVQKLAEHARADAAARRRAVARRGERVDLVEEDDGRRGRARLGDQTITLTLTLPLSLTLTLAQP